MRDDELLEYSEIVARLRRGPHPIGEEFELCREVLAAAPKSFEATQALRLLLEGAMADAGLSIADAQGVMRLLKALDQGLVTAADVLLHWGGER